MMANGDYNGGLPELSSFYAYICVAMKCSPLKSKTAVGEAESGSPPSSIKVGPARQG